METLFEPNSFSMRFHRAKKWIFLIIILFLYYKLRTKYHYYQIKLKSKNHHNTSTANNEIVIQNINDLKYILQWTLPYSHPFIDIDEGQQAFIVRKCRYTNCLITHRKSYLNDYTKFNAIVFYGPKVVRTFIYNLPIRRSPDQVYIFANNESSHYYPVCANNLDGFFNWTWTYKLDSEIWWGYMNIKDKYNYIIGPNKVMNWIKLEDMDPVSNEFKERLSKKTKAAAWFVSNCNSKSKREEIVLLLQNELAKYELEVDIYGACGGMACGIDNEDLCEDLIKYDYYFYLAFENSLSEDYVTEKLLHALKNDVVPIVYGGANYTRFMPDGIYLNVMELGVVKLAEKMNELINDIEKYSEYFKWQKYYSYDNHYTSETDPYCLLCNALNDKNMVKTTRICKKFRKWWDPPNLCK